MNWAKRVLMAAVCAASTGCLSDPLPVGEGRLASEEEPEDCPLEVTCYGSAICPPEVSCFRDKQSRRLQGTAPPLERTSFSPDSAFWSLAPGPPIESVRADERGLVVIAGGQELSDEELPGLAFLTTAGNVSYRLRIAGAAGPDARGRHRYRVEQMDGSGDWQPLCDGHDWAYALPAVFAVAGPPEEVRALGFACRRGAVAKAIRWGFGPWGGHLAHFRAAVQLARADYCGRDETHTVDGTAVLVQDVDGLGQDSIRDDGADPPVDSPAPFFFEAGWRGTDERDTPVLCLTKLRWQSLRPGGLCAEVPDPRTVERAAFCEDLGGDIRGPDFLPELRRHGALVFSSSQRNEAGLWVWKRQGGQGPRYLTTTRGFWGGQSGATEPPIPGHDIAFGDQSFVASVLTFDRGSETVELYQYTDASGAFRTTTDPHPPGAWIAREVIGYVYAADTVPAPFRPVELRTLVKTTGGAQVLLASSFNPVPAGYIDTGIIEGYGFVLP